METSMRRLQGIDPTTGAVSGVRKGELSGIGKSRISCLERRGSRRSVTSLLVPALIEKDKVMVKMHRRHEPVKWRGAAMKKLFPVQAVHQSLAQGDRSGFVARVLTAAVIRPVGGLQVFDDVDPSLGEPGKRTLKDVTTWLLM